MILFFSVKRDRNTPANNLNNNVLKIRSWIYQWIMNFNPDLSKQTQEVTFSCKIKKLYHAALTFDNNQIIIRK